MALPPVQLDDLTWEDLRSLAQRRIPAASAGHWSHHAPVDPGVTLLELFAFLLEQRIFLLDQFPDSLIRAMLSLLGEQPRPVGIASTVLSFTNADIWANPGPAPQVATGAVFRGRDPELGGLAFTVREAVTPLPVRRIELFVNGEDRSTDLDEQRPIPLMPQRDQPGDVRIVLWLKHQVPVVPFRAPITLFYHLDARAEVAPEWATDAANEIPAPAELSWWFSGPPAGDPLPFRAEEIHDGTGGLRRSGIVRLPMSESWTPIASAQVPYGYPYALWLRTEKASYSEPPRLLQMVPNSAIAVNRERVDLTSDPSALAAVEQQIAKWLPNSSLSLDLPDSFRPPIPDSASVELKDRHGRWQHWKPTADLSFTGPADRVFTVDRPAARLAFGDGYTGRVPAPASAVKISLDVGGGPIGNVGAELGWDPALGAGAPSVDAVNPLASSGGAEPESLEAAKERVAKSLQQRFRAVTPEDYRTLVETTPGIVRHRVHIAAGFDPHFPCVRTQDSLTVFVVPRVGRDNDLLGPEGNITNPTPLPDPGALGLIRDRLEAARLIGIQVFVLVPRYRAVALRVEAAADAADPAGLSGLLRRALGCYLDPLVGGINGDGWPFGRPLRPSELLRVAQDTIGEEGRIEVVGIAIDGESSFEDCDDVEIGPNDLVHLSRFELALRNATVQTGGLL